MPKQKTIQKFIILIVAAVLLANAGLATALPTNFFNKKPKTTEIIVKFKSSASPRAVKSIILGQGAKVDGKIRSLKAVNLKVAKSDPGIKGDRVSGATKPATMESGLVVQVPLHINEGDTLRIDTESGDYVERVNLNK